MYSIAIFFEKATHSIPHYWIDLIYLEKNNKSLTLCMLQCTVVVSINKCVSNDCLTAKQIALQSFVHKHLVMKNVTVIP